MEPRKLGPFELEEKLGVGGMGVVYRAKYLKTGQIMAVKVLSPDLASDPQLAKRFEREMEILKKLQHPHIVRYYGGSTSGSQAWYAMEWIPGGSLDQLLKERKKLNWEDALEYGLQICKALEHAHQHGVIHRDLKPANLLLTKDGTIKLSDFGIARDSQSTAITAAGKTVGTMAYMAPEQIKGKPPVSNRTDLYALGCVLFELLTGRTPFVAETQPEVLFKHLDEDPPTVREYNMDCPIWLEQVIEHLLAKDPADRPFDALATQLVLEDVKTKVATQRSVAAHTASSRATLGGGKTQPDREVLKLLGQDKPKKKKKRNQAPFYERAWFLSLCLVAIIGLITWGFWPLSERELHARAAKLMATEEIANWENARREYIDPLLKRYPAGDFADDARGWIDRIDDYYAEKNAERAEKDFERGRDLKNEAEKLYVAARQYEKFGDRLTALKQYESMQVVLASDEEAKPYLRLAARRIEKIQQDIQGKGDRAGFVNSKLQEADDLYANGRVAQAEVLWQSILRLYSDSAEFEPQVGVARAKLRDPKSDNPFAKGADVPSGQQKSKLPGGENEEGQEDEQAGAGSESSP